MAMSTGAKVGAAIVVVLGGAAAFAGSRASAQSSEAACMDAPGVAALYTSRPRMLAWAQCVERTAEQAAECSRLMDASGRGEDAAYVRDAWNRRATLAARKPDGQLSPEAMAEVRQATTGKPPAPEADPAPTPARFVPGRRVVVPMGGGGAKPPRTLPGARSAAPTPTAPVSTPTRTRTPPRVPGRSPAPTRPELQPLSQASIDAERRRTETEAAQDAETERRLDEGGDVPSTPTPHGRVILPTVDQVERVPTSTVSGQLAPVVSGEARVVTSGTILAVDANKARRLGGPLSKMMRGAVRGQHMGNVRAFQRAAGIPDDGRYSGLVVNALRHYGIQSPTPALYEPDASAPEAAYAPTAQNAQAPLPEMGQ